MKILKYSIFKKGAEIIKDNDDEMEIIIKCPNCGKPIKYGDLRIISGYSGCENILDNGKECFDDLQRRVRWAKENDYAAYSKGNFYITEQ